MDEVMTQADVDLIMTAADSITEAASPVGALNTTTPSSSSGTEPCAVLSRTLAAMPSGARPVVPAELGVSCLQSVPLDKAGNVELIDDLKVFVKWQSNVAYLRNPPKEYTEKAVDIMGELDTMQKQVAVGGFKSEYEFQLQMLNLFTSAYDNHFAYQPDILASAMQFQRPPGSELVSVSSDGKAMPEIYVYRDVLRANNDTSFKPSPVKMINGMDAQKFLANESMSSDFHDADTRWNALFPSQALLASGTTYLGSFRTGQYQGPNTTFQFANGTTWSQMNIAVAFGNFTGVESGSAFFKRFCNGPAPVAPKAPKAPAPSPISNSTKPSTPTPKPAPSQIGYPKAQIVNPNLAVAGYYLDGAAYKDVAVLSIPSYESPDVQTFQNTMRDFIRMCQKAGKTKMIFDMRGNGGGNAILGYDTFKQVYPQASADPYGGTRFRAHDGFNSAGKITQDFLANKTYAQSNRTAFAQNFGRGTTQQDVFSLVQPFNYQHTLDINNKAISNWSQIFGPVQANGDNFTTTLRYNFTDSLSTTYTGFSVIGFGANLNETKTPLPFKPQDMVMLQDGMCSSTCALAAELLKNQGAIRTIVIGGRPQPGPMQGVGGTKGAQVFAWDDIQIRMQAVFFLGSPEQQKEWNNTDLGKTAFAKQLFKRSAYNAGQIAGGVNLKDNLRLTDTSGTPLEFMYEAADCRMWFTSKMVSDVTEVWKGVADRMFMGNGTMMGCVEGSTGAPSSVSGGGQLRGGDGKMLMKSASVAALAAKAPVTEPKNVTSPDIFKGSATRGVTANLGFGFVASVIGLTLAL
ncbi:peptidase S41 family [Pyrenophora seminiperda CCB06]|uniref:Peptidase S41 family n=1 Tax=Pyrenophora seminiperda CCB06 TaxID=1302712 RepID=A0A3M7M788_9PLEO|nr:peptidase S41 family [Pyrenophora seminiperda CCB06]